MKKILTFCLFVLSVSTGFMAAAQCGAGGITFSTQADVDNFTTNYPGCTQILGNVTITGNSITNLNGLSTITYVGGTLDIFNTRSLTDITGLSNLITVVGTTNISANQNLTALTGLSALTSAGNLFISNNAKLINLTGLSALNSVGHLGISQNGSLNSLTGLTVLTTIGGGLQIETNRFLTSLGGLSGITSIGASSQLKISNNDALINLSGLSGFTSVYTIDIIGNDALTSLSGFSSLTSVFALFIQGNSVLTNLNGFPALTSAFGILISGNPALTSLNGLFSRITSLKFLEIRSNQVLLNLSGLSSITSLGSLNINGNPVLTDLSGLSSITSLGFLTISGNTGLTSLNGLFPGITALENLEISSNNALTSLSGLPQIVSIARRLTIRYNPVLTSLSELSALTSVGYDIEISDNAKLTNLTALSAITTLGGSINIYNNNALLNISGLSGITTTENLFISNNKFLTSLTGLSGIRSVRGYIYINSNTALTSLTGLNNINPTTITGLYLLNNPLLTYCELPNICCYLSNPNNLATISGNAPNCATRMAVETACTIYAAPIITSTTPNSICGQGTVTLGATSNVGVINWYNVPSGGISLFTGTTFITPSISTTTAYYVDATDGCTFSARTQVDATVNPVPVIGTPSVINANCNGSATGKVTVSATGGTGAITYSIAPNIGTQSPSGTFNGLTAQTYTVTATDANSCTQSSSIIVTEPPKIIITQFSPITSIQCVGSTITFNAVATGVNMTVKWQKNGNDVTSPVPYSSSTTAIYTTSALVASDNGATYRAVFQDGCPNDEMATAVGTVTVNTPSVGGTLSPAQSQGCGPTTVNLSVSGINGSITQWERQTNCNGVWASIGSAGLSAKTVTTPNSTTCYRVKVANGVCPAAYSTISTVIVDKPAVGGNVSLQGNQNATTVALCPGQNAILTLGNSVGHILKWQYSFGNTNSWVDLPNTENAQSLAVNGSSVSGAIYYRAVINTELSICTGTVSIAYSTAFKITKKTNCLSPDGRLTDTDIATDKGIKIMKAYPNPTSGFISLNIENVIARDEAKGAFQIEVLDLMGRIVQLSQQNLDEGYNILSLDMSNLSSGLYLVRIKDRDKHEAVVRVSKL